MACEAAILRRQCVAVLVVLAVSTVAAAASIAPARLADGADVGRAAAALGRHCSG